MPPPTPYVRWRTDSSSVLVYLFEMLHDFLKNHRSDLIARCRQSAARRASIPEIGLETKFGIPLFLDQLTETLEAEYMAEFGEAEEISGQKGGPSRKSQIASAGLEHGRELSRQGLSVEQVVHEYGDLCQAITGLALELDAPIETTEFKTLNRCLDNVIADAVTEFSYQRELINADRETQALNQRIGFLAHELRNHINTATLALRVIKSGQAGFAGAMGGVLDRSLIGLRTLVDQSLAEVRMTPGMATPHQVISIADLFAELLLSTSLEAQSRGCQLRTSAVDAGLVVVADRDLLLAAIGNLLQNAFKFTKYGTQVMLSAHTDGDHVHIEVQDHCGGLGPGNHEDFFRPFAQYGTDKTGVGLGLSISRRSVEASHGTLSVRDLPGSGCVFSIRLPMHLLPASS